MKSKTQKTILLVEDDAITSMAEKKLLEKYNFKVITAFTGEEAVETVEKTRGIDLILMDIDLGIGMDGTEAAKKILEGQDLPLIFFSSHIEREVVEKTEGITFYGYIVKDSGENVLMASIKMAFKLFNLKVMEKVKDNAIRESEERLSSFMDSATDSFYLLDSEMNFVDINRKGLEIIGKKKEDVIGCNITDIVPDIKESGRYDKHLEVMRTGKPFMVEDFVPHPVFGDMHFLLKSFNVGDGLGVIASDITERKQAEVLLSESEKKYHILYDTMLQGVVYQDAEGRIISANPAAGNILGLSLDQMQGKTSVDPRWKAIKEDKSEFPGEEHPAMVSLKTGQPVHNVVMGVFIPEQEKYRWISIDAVPQFRPGENMPFQVYAMFTDITERKQAEETLEKSYQEKKELFRELQHRAKNSFMMITSMIEIKKNAGTSDEAKEVLSEIGLRIRAVSQLYDMLYLTDSITEVQLDKYLNQVASKLPGISKNFTLNINFDAVTVPVKTAIPVGIMIVEFITNSVKYAFPDNAKGTIALLLKMNDTGAVLEVADDGIGLPHGFDISTSDSMGLKIVHVLVKQIRGTIKIESGKGTRYVIEFPIE